MSKIKALNKLAKAWGIEPDYTSVPEALEAIAENPPFGVKTEMVEIVPEQSVTRNMPSDHSAVYIHVIDSPSYKIINGSVYNVVLNEKSYNLGSRTEYIGGSPVVVLGSSTETDLTEPPFSIEYDTEMNVCMITWLKSLGETITLAIYEEQEVVKQIDPKFVGGGKYFHITEKWDEQLQATVFDKTFEETLEAINNYYAPIVVYYNSVYTYMEHNYETSGEELSGGYIKFGRVTFSGNNINGETVTMNYGSQVLNYNSTTLYSGGVS